ncbi:MAG: hypothetical protein O3C34_13605 [Proteobacteria bacterium]|nr:hypothetical protein [Pseudomonadota bacterium]
MSEGLRHHEHHFIDSIFGTVRQLSADAAQDAILWPICAAPIAMQEQPILVQDR